MSKTHQGRGSASRRAGAQHQPPAAPSDASPSNTASDKCNGQYFKPLRWGVDSLYLSYPGRLLDEVEGELERLKGIAQSEHAPMQALAQYSTSGHIFEVKDKGSGLFAFVLEDNTFRMALSRNKAKSLPMAYVRVSSDYLCHVTPKDAELRLGAVVRGLGTLSEMANVSRIDLFVDFVSDFDMEGWNRHAWVTRASEINSYSVNGQFSGWTVGLGGPISARLYDKTLEIATKRPRDALKDLWSIAGWDQKERVWRLEFQFRRELLGQKGLQKIDGVLANLNGLWSYGLTEWLRLTLPNAEDETRSRWPIHPLWGWLSSVDFGAYGGPLSPRFSATRAPDDDYFYSRVLSVLVSYMAREGITDFDKGAVHLLNLVHDHYLNLCFDVLGMPLEQFIAQKVASKARQYNTMVNSTPEIHNDVNAGIAEAAEAYRRASRGW